VSPAPRIPRPLGWLIHRPEHRLPAEETWQGTRVVHPRYRHWPGMVRRQADAMADGARAAVAALHAEGPIVIDAHYLWPDGVAAARLAAELGAPFVLTARGTDLNVIAGDPAVAARIAEAAARAHACCAVSRALCDRFAEVAGLPRERILEVRNGVDLDRFRPGDGGGERAGARAALGLPAAGRWLLGVGRLVPGKGFAVAARALAELPGDVSLALVGDGPERAAIEAIGGSRVHFLGALPPDRTALAYRAADLFVLPTEREGWPNVVTEALASGLRVVSTPVGGIPQIFGDHPPPPTLGALVPPRDARALAAAVRTLLEIPADPAAVRAFGERYGWEQPVRQLAEIFRRALGERTK
jgi:glycosyltransferase involved in cell wall biosynthesis